MKIEGVIRLGKLKTTKEFMSNLNEKFNNEFEAVSEYTGNKNKITVKHKICGELIERYAGDLLKTGCKKCNQRKMGRRSAKTTEQYKEEVFNLVGDEYLVLGEYVRNKKPVVMKHNTEHCKHEFSMNPNSFLRGQRCPICGHAKKSEKLRRKKDDVISQIHSIENGRYSIVSEYKNQRDTILIFDSKCKGTFETNFEKFVKYKRCQCCSPNPSALKTQEEFERIVYEQHGDEYTILGEYTGKENKIEVRHEKCGEIFNPTAHNLARGSGCPVCNTASNSKGAKRVQKNLEELKLLYRREFYIKGCRGKKGAYKFDFAVFDKDGNIICVIEYDGKQHFEAVEFFGGIEGLKDTQKRDKNKNNYCYKNGIPIYRIPYWEFENIDIIVKTIFELE